MKKQRSLINAIRIMTCLLSLLLVLVIGILWLIDETTRSRLQTEKIRSTYLTTQKEIIKSEVDHTLGYIKFKRNQLEKRVRNDVRNRTEEAYQTALYIYENNKQDASLSTIGTLIHDALYAASWDDGRGYYFAEDMNGVELINRNNPDLEGQNIVDVQDSNGKYIMKEILAVANSSNREGYCTYYWNSPINPDTLSAKISYVKYFEPLNWVIGTGKYLDVEEAIIQKEIIAWLEETSFADSRYMFAGTWDGVSLSGPAKGKNMWDITDPNGVKIVQELINNAQQGGGFVEYVMPKLKGNRPDSKISYSAPVSEWEWYIGTGIYVDFIENEIAHQQELLKQSIREIILKVFLVLCFFLFLSTLLCWWFAGKIQKNLSLFLDFFARSAVENLKIQSEKVSFSEFKSVAASANKMVEERQQTLNELSAEQERLAVTLQSIGDGVITTDIKGTVVLLNPVAEDLTGWKNNEAQGKQADEVFSVMAKKSGQPCQSPISSILLPDGVTGFTGDSILIAKNGIQRHVSNSGAPIRDREGNTIGAVLVFRDVSDEKRVEEELLKMKKLESVGVLAGGIAHDFNNILSAILGSIELVDYRITSKEVETKSLLSSAKKAIKRATKLTGQLLTFSKGGEPVKEKTSLGELITESADFVLHGSKVLCEYYFPDDLWMTDVDGGQISQVIQNIIINAKHAMPEGGTITIRCSNVPQSRVGELPGGRDGDYVRVTIEDTGIGIPQEIVDKIFDPYFTTKNEGSGLGLAISHSIVSKHQGFLTVDSIPGKGSVFTLSLPAIGTTEQESIKGAEMVKAVKAARIMVMDDEQLILDVMKSQLAVLGHEAILVNGGEEAITRYRELMEEGNPVDLVIMDLTIPGGMGGQAAAEELLEIDENVKMIVASGYSNDPVMANYEKYGFCGAVGKPFDLDELSRILASSL